MDAVEDQIDNFLSNGVVSASKVIGGIFFASDQLLWMEQLTVGAGARFINHSWLEVNHDATGHMLASACLTEEGVEGIITTTDGFVTWHLSIRLDSVLEAEKLPASIANLDASLSE